MSNYSHQNKEVKPEDLKIFDVVRVKHGGNNTTGVVMQRLYRFNTDQVTSLLIYPITPVRAPTQAERSSHIHEAKEKQQFYYVAAAPGKAEMGLDPQNDYKINYTLTEVNIPENRTLKRLGVVKASTPQLALNAVFEKDSVKFSKAEKTILDAGTRKLLGGPATFAYDKIANSSATPWAAVGAKEVDKRLEAGKAKKREYVEPDMPQPVLPGSLYDIYARMTQTGEVELAEPEAETAIEIPAPADAPQEIAVAEIEIVQNKKRAAPVKTENSEPDITLGKLFNAGMISEQTRNVMFGSTTGRAHVLLGKDGTALSANDSPVKIKTLMQAYNYMAENDIRKIFGVGPVTAENVEYEIKSAVEDLMGFDVK